MPECNKFQVLIVDDHPITREGLRLLLDRQPEFRVTGQAGSIEQALREVKRRTPDLMIVDLSLPDGDGVSLIKELRARGHRMPIVVFSFRDERVHAASALAAGASGYLEKYAEPGKLLAALRDAVAGRMAVSERVAGYMASGEVAYPAPRAPRLSRREQQVLNFISEGLGTRLISVQLGLSIKTIETYRENIKRKLGFANGFELVRHAVLMGQRTAQQASVPATRLGA